MPKRITEAAGTATALTGARQRVELITPGWGSSGYYSPAVLEQAAKERAFPAGTQMHLDHQTPREEAEQPAGSVRTLAAVLTEDAYWDPSVPGLVAEARVFSPWAPVLAEMKDAIGVSISAAAEFKPGEAEGRKGAIIERLVPDTLNRVDFVTHAGRGGRIAAVLEHYRPATEATANDVERQLRDQLRAAYGDEDTYVWLEDRDEAGGIAWYSVETPETTTTWQTGYAITDTGEVTLTGETVQVRRVTQYVPLTTDAAEAAAVAEAVDLPAIGDRIVIDPERLHDPAHTTGTIAEIGSTAYGVVMDGMSMMGIHRWYTAEEFDYLDEPGADDGMPGMEAKKKRRKKPMAGMKMSATQKSAPNPAAATRKEATMATIDDAELARLRESASRAAALETENAALRESDRRRHVEALVSAAFDVESPRVRAALVAEHLAPEHADEAITAAAREAAAEVRAARGEGQVHGNGQTTAPGAVTESADPSDEDIRTALNGGR